MQRMGTREENNLLPASFEGTMKNYLLGLAALNLNLRTASNDESRVGWGERLYCEPKL